VAGALVASTDSSVTVYADSLGNFVIPLPRAGPHGVRAEQFGYVSEQFDLDALARNRMQVLRLEPAPFELEEITAEAEANIARLVRNVGSRRNAAAVAVASLDREGLDRFGRGATVYDVIRRRASRITECWDNVSDFCTWSRSLSFRSAYPRVRVGVCVDEIRSMAPVPELSNMSIESVALVEIFGRNEVRVYTTSWMLHQARAGRTNVLPLWMGC
jgi:hypothetical protein